MIICDIIVGYTHDPKDDDYDIIVKKSDLDEIIKSSLINFYKSGFTNTANTVFENLKNELIHYDECRINNIPYKKLNDIENEA